MKIGMSVWPLIPGFVGGSETYVRNLLCHLVEDSNDELWLWLDFLNYRSFAGLGNNNVHRFISGGLPLPGPVWIERNLFRALRRLRLLRFLPGPVHYTKQGDVGLDVFHFPFCTLDVRVSDVPVVTTIYDLQHEIYPQFFPQEEIDRRHHVLSEVAVRSTLVMAISEFTRLQFLETYQIPEEQVITVQLGVDSAAFQPNDAAVLESGSRLTALPKPYLFYPANTWFHKNHVRLLDAMSILVHTGWRDLHLVLTGAEKNAHVEIKHKIRELGLEKYIIWLGHVSQTELALLYQNAAVMVFPSLFEGFGLPVLEAMAAGCPVVCSKTASLPEVAGDAALYFDPVDVESMVASVERVLNDMQLRGTLRERGRQRAQQFTWQSMAERTRQAYQLAMERYRKGETRGAASYPNTRSSR